MSTTQMIEQAAAAPRAYGYLSRAEFDTKAGKVACFVDHNKNQGSAIVKRAAVRFSLNGSNVSRAHLDSLLSQ